VRLGSTPPCLPAKCDSFAPAPNSRPVESAIFSHTRASFPKYTMVHLRLNENESNPNPHVNFITALPAADPQEQERARQLLRALAAQVKPIMKAHGFAVNSLEEVRMCDGLWRIGVCGAERDASSTSITPSLLGGTGITERPSVSTFLSRNPETFGMILRSRINRTRASPTG